MEQLKYPFVLTELDKEDGGGYLIEFPDLPGCLSDGESVGEALANGREALKDWLAAAEELGRVIPKPGELSTQSGKWVQRVPRSLHLRLVKQAKQEGVSLNTLVVSMISEELGKRAPHNNKRS